MLALVNDGFVIAERNRGFRVVEVPETDLDEICQIRLMLEVPAAVEVAKSIAPEVLDRLAGISDEIVDAAASGNLIDYLNADRRFTPR
jgi:DNA-binding GntR family transcriptional regulator